MDILNVTNLSKSFSKKQVIKNISFNVKQGEIIGFVGPNGAGKTTTIKLITNLIYPDSGQISINGYNLFADRANALSNIAAIIENPGLYTYLTGRDNLEFIRRMRNCSRERMNSIIEHIGLSDRIDDTVKNYSLGMKQRLALGMCLLPAPKLLILDEPTNGLDPDGTIEFRNMIINLAKKEKTSVLFSSHLLSEVERVCDRIIFIKDGKIVSILDKSTLRDNQLYKLSVGNAEEAYSALIKSDKVLSASVAGDNEILLNIKAKAIEDILKLLTEKNITFTDINRIEIDLETEYIKIFEESTNKNGKPDCF